MTQKIWIEISPEFTKDLAEALGRNPEETTPPQPGQYRVSYTDQNGNKEQSSFQVLQDGTMVVGL